ncbi:MAG: lysophospholipase [Firmicutes bacterium]|nr:lysophospholipase [Bacillota bacterium]
MNTYKETFIKGKNDVRICLRIWDNVANPKGVIQIFHGMAEYSIRYNDFANFLNGKGFLVYGNDHRGHGMTLKNTETPGFLGENGFYNIVEDTKIISDLIKNNYTGLPLFIFAHSFGSFIAQEYIVHYSNEIDGLILSGSAKQSGIDVKAAYILASMQNKLFDNRKEAKLIDRLTFGSYNKRIKKRKTEFDWLSHDGKIVDDYIKDRLCGYISPIDFYYNFFGGLKNLYKPKKMKNISKSLPILIISGSMDPIGKYGRLVEKLYEQYKSLNMENVTLRLIEDCRHEILNETNKKDVYDYIYNWIMLNYSHN